MKRLLMIAAGMLLPLAFVATPAAAQTAARNYDCTKAGNANKAVCKAAAAAAKPAPAPKTATRNYDCSKPGNANKTVCKTAAAPKPPVMSPAATERHYDCSKAGNANKTACKGTGSVAAPTASKPAPTVAAPRAPTASKAPVVGQNTNPGGPNGATAKCKDGSYSFSAHRSGTCSRHGGVAQFY